VQSRSRGRYLQRGKTLALWSTGRINSCSKSLRKSSLNNSPPPSSLKPSILTNYSQLLNSFKETHEEANKLALSNNRLRGLNNWLEKIFKVLEEELKNLKNDF